MIVSTERPNGVTSPLQDPVFLEQVELIYRKSRMDSARLLGALPQFVALLLRRRQVSTAVDPQCLRGALLPAAREMTEFLYATCIATNSQTVLEYGTSYGASTLFLGAAARELGGRVHSAEVVAEKCVAARAAVRHAGLQEYVEVHEGDALVTLTRTGGAIDLLFLDGWKELYLPLLKALTPRFRRGTVLVADNVNFPDARDYVAYVQQLQHGFVSVPIFGGGSLYSVYVGGAGEGM